MPVKKKGPGAPELMFPSKPIIPYTKGTLMRALQMMDCSDDTPIHLYDSEWQELEVTHIRVTQHPMRKYKIILLDGEE